jgi:UDP:flavonoid glycosyltransferase YjiC (YdhE family)
MTAAPIVLAATPLTGHIRPVLNLARHLVAAGRRVTVVSGSRFVPQAEAAGAAFVPLAGPADRRLARSRRAVQPQDRKPLVAHTLYRPALLSRAVTVG